MEKIKFPKEIKFYVPLVILFLIMMALMPRAPKFQYEYRKGSPWMYETLVAQFDFPILKSNSELFTELDDRISEVIPYYRLDQSISVKKLKDFSVQNLGEWQDAKSPLFNALAGAYQAGILNRDKPEDNTTSSKEAVIYIQKDKRSVKAPAAEFYTIEEARNLVESALLNTYPGCNADSLYQALGLGSLLAPNMIFDEEITKQIHNNSISVLSETEGIFRAGNIIVAEEQIVTEDIEKLLKSYKAEYDIVIGSEGGSWTTLLGNGIVALGIITILFLTICICNWKIFKEYNKYLYLLTIFGIVTAVSLSMVKASLAMYFCIPMTLGVLYLLAFFDKKLVFNVYFISLLPMLIYASDGVMLFTMYLIAGTVAMVVYGKFSKGWLQFVTAMIVFCVLVIVWMAFVLMDNQDMMSIVSYLICLAIGSLLSVFAYPMIFLFEKIYGLVSNTRLSELCDTNNPLLRELADKAPGTFQHSLQVMNLADAAARAIGANVVLVRAGALYHDIGKIVNPQCFTENETANMKYHAGLSAKESAQEIIKHVSDGLVLADKYGLPNVIKEFISTHHGTSAAGYFLTKYLNDGGDPNDVSEFYYNGHKPNTKEQAVLMICDSVEAASRSLKDYSPESISELVDRIVWTKVDDDQLDDADITFHDTTLIKNVIKAYIQQMYHSRISYPKRKDKAR